MNLHAFCVSFFSTQRSLYNSKDELYSKTIFQEIAKHYHYLVRHLYKLKTMLDLDISTRTERDYLYGWIKKTVTYAKISPKMVNPRDRAGNAEEEDLDIIFIIGEAHSHMTRQLNALSALQIILAAGKVGSQMTLQEDDGLTICLVRTPYPPASVHTLHSDGSILLHLQSLQQPLGQESTCVFLQPCQIHCMFCFCLPLREGRGV